MRPTMHGKMAQALARVQETQAIALSVAQMEAELEEESDDREIQFHNEKAATLVMRVQHLSIRIRQVRKERAREYCGVCALSLATMALVHALQVRTYEKRKRSVVVNKKKLDELLGQDTEMLHHAERSLARAKEVEAGLALLNMDKLGRLTEYTLARQPLLEDILDIARAALFCQEDCDNLVRSHLQDRKAALAKERLASWKKRIRRA